MSRISFEKMSRKGYLKQKEQRKTMDNDQQKIFDHTNYKKCPKKDVRTNRRSKDQGTIQQNDIKGYKENY